MKMKKALSAVGLLLALTVVGCGSNAASSAAGTSSNNANTSAGGTSQQSAPAQSSAPAVPTPDANQALVTQQAVPDEDGNGETISWDAQDANKEANDFSSSGKFNSSNSYVQYTFNASMAMKARLFVTVENRSDNVWNRETQEGHQSIWYNWYDGDDWKYNVDVNTIRIDQSEMGTYKVNDVDIPMKELVYTDFLAEGASTLEAPWFEFDVLQGRNTIKIARNLGYSVKMKSFKVVGKKAAAPAGGSSAAAGDTSAAA